MLKRYDFSFSSQGIGNVYSELAVKIHGVLMHSIPGEVAVKMHEKKYHPFSLFCVLSEDGSRIITRVSSLCEDADSIVETASRLDTIDIKGMGEVCIYSGGEIYEKSLSQLIDEVSGKRFRLMFMTPSVFKTGGKETGFPDVSMHFLSVIRRMKEFEGENIDFDEFRKAFYKCKITDWQFANHSYNISGINVPGMTGYTDIILPDGEEQILLKKVFIYASFSGTGGRTGMGMGGFFFQKK